MLKMILVVALALMPFPAFAISHEMLNQITAGANPTAAKPIPNQRPQPPHPGIAPPRPRPQKH